MRRGAGPLALAVALAAGGLVLFASTAGCASARSGGDVGDPTPLVVESLGRSDGKPDRDGREAQRLAGVHGVWRRGDVLTVDTDEGIQYRFVDAGACEGFYTCRRWTFEGSGQSVGQDPHAHPIDYRLIHFDQGEGGYWLAIDPAGGSSTVLDTRPAISPDKRRWATGECNEESGDDLKILESDAFGRLILAAEAGDAPCCDILGWDGAALNVRSCDLEPGKAFDDRLERGPDGRWAGKRLRLQRPQAR